MMNGKRRWLYSLLSLVLCVAMFLGTTLAWFSDTISLSGRVEAGKLKIDFQKYDGTEYVTLRGSDKNIFDDGDTETYWEPGMTKILYLAVKNQETLPVKYQILIDVSGIEAEDGTFEYALYDGVQAPSEQQAALDATADLNVVDRWAELKKFDGVQKGTILSETYTAAPQGRLDAQGDVDYFALAVHMSEEAGNEYQGKDIDVNVTLEATQIDGYLGEGPYLGNSVILNQDFENSEALIKAAGTGYFKQRVTEGEGDSANTYFLIENTGAANLGEAHLTMSQLDSMSDFVVYEFDFKVKTLGSWFNLYINQNESQAYSLGVLKVDNTFVTPVGNFELDLDTWYTIAIAVNYYAGTMDYYWNDELVGSTDLPSQYNSENKIPSIRFHRTKFGDFGNTTENDYSMPFAVGFDNLKVYDAKAPMDDLGEIVKVITMTDESVFPDETAIINSLSGYTAVHKVNGLVFVNGEKEFLPTVPWTDGDKTMIKTAELASILGVTLPDGTAADMDVEEFYTTVLNKTVTTDDDTVYNNGLVIAGDTAYTLPTDADELKALTDYLFFLRPSDDDLMEMYNASSMKGVHPRIQATADDFARIRQIYNDKSDPDIYAWAQAVIYTADATMDKDPVFYELRDGSRLLAVSREVLSKMYAYGMAYQITQDQKYADRGFKELKAVCEFMDWHPSHALDTGEMAAAVAIGYDWLYEALTPAERKIVEQGMYNNAFYDAMILYQTADGHMTPGCFGESNWNNVVSGGLIVGALSMLDVYPDEASRILQHAVRSADIYLFRYAPIGAWYEGPSYWDYATTYMVKAHSALETTLGTDLRLGLAEGVRNAANYIIDMQSDNGTFNIGDGITSKIYTPELFYLADKYDNPAVSAITMEKSNRKMGTGEHLALGLLWYDPATSGSIDEFELDAIYYDRDNGVVTMHDTFESGETTFAAIHAGTNNLSHAHLDAGSFTFVSDGVTWVEELGQDNYNQGGYWDETDNGKRWQIFRMRAEAHSVPVINPTAAQDQEYISVNPITKFEPKDKGTIVLTDLTDAYRVNATKLLRGLQFTDNRRSLVIRDEMTMKNANSQVYWFLLTQCDLEIQNTEASTTNKVTFTKDGRSMTMDIITSVPGVVSYDVAKPLNSETVYNTVETVKRLQIYFADVTGDVNITVKMTPNSVVNPTDVADYNVDMSTWTVPDGKRPAKLKLDSLLIDGVADTLEGYTVTSYYVEGQITTVPEIVATAGENVDVVVNKGASLDEVTTITLTDKTDATNTAVYSITFKAVPAPVNFEGKTSIPAVNAVGSCTPQPANVATNVIDANSGTKWAGDTAGNHITIDLKTVQALDGLAVLFQGDAGRIYDYVVSVSEDGDSFTDVWEGKSLPTVAVSAGEVYSINDFSNSQQARYVRVTVTGNNQSSKWTSIAEVVAYRNN